MKHFTKYYSILAVGLLMVLLFSCREDELGPSIFVIPGGIHIQTNAGALIEFDIEAQQGDNSLRNIVITEKPTGGVTSVLLDTMVSGSTADFFFVYEVPDGWDDVLVAFTVYDSENLEGGTARRLFIEGNSLLTESTGHNIYSRFSSSLPDAFDLTTNDPIILSTLSDSTNVHITENDTEDDDNLSLSFTSYSGNKFVRNNSFNYPEATESSAQNTYESSTALQIINDLEVDDILITKYDTVNNLYAVIKITGFQDDSGSNNDRYTFNIKK